jgi:hypothetical protein
VSRELFEKAQLSFTKPDVKKSPFFKTPNTENVFAGKVFCGHCGYSMVRKRMTERLYSYKCHTRQRYTHEACVGMLMKEADLKAEMFALIMRYEPFLGKVLSPFTGAVAEADKSKKELASAQSELSRNKRYLEGLYESLVSGDITDAEYKEMKLAYEAKTISLAERIKLLRETIHSRAAQDAALSQAYSNVRMLERISDLTAELIDRLVERITVYPNGRIAVKFSFLGETIYNKEEGAGNE